MFFLELERKEVAIRLDEILEEQQLAELYRLDNSLIATTPINIDVGGKQQSATFTPSMQSTSHLAKSLILNVTIGESLIDDYQFVKNAQNVESTNSLNVEDKSSVVTGVSKLRSIGVVSKSPVSELFDFVKIVIASISGQVGSRSKAKEKVLT